MRDIGTKRMICKCKYIYIYIIIHIHIFFTYTYIYIYIYVIYILYIYIYMISGWVPYFRHMYIYLDKALALLSGVATPGFTGDVTMAPCPTTGTNDLHDKGLSHS